MLTCHSIRAAGTWSETVPTDCVHLDFDGRHRRRHAMAGEAGLVFLLDLPQATALRDGDGLVLSDGRIVRVRAAPERLMEVVAPDPTALVRIAWHVGNRHLPTQILEGRLRLRHDHVIEEMMRGLGATVTAVEAAFDPEGGAFGHAPAGAPGIDSKSPHAHTHAHGQGHHEHPRGA